MVGNAYNYNKDDWAYQTALAKSKGFDAFALNIGSDDWQEKQVQKAFDAVRGFDFNLFISFDMTAIPCSVPSDALRLQKYRKFQGLPNYQRINSKPLVSTFAGQDCKFGNSSSNDGWYYAVKQFEPIYFMPSFFVDPAKFSEYDVMDGAFNWNSAWPLGDYDVNFASDTAWIENLGDRSYMAGVSPWFFTHYPRTSYDDKNFIYLCDNWMFATRWDLLISNRDKVAIVHAITWNDFGESHYLAPLLKHDTQPSSEAWVDGFNHEDWLDLFTYYIQAFKTGVYPTIDRDRIFLWSRLYPAEANASNDSMGPPDNYKWSQDFLWAIVLLAAPADVVLQCGSTRQTWGLPSGLAKLKLPLTTACSVTAFVLRGDNSDMMFSPAGFDFRTDPSTYNFNAFVAASP
ncbi:glycoside hydrolase family 71 protein [Mycena latifolia]|nr:glycoside hydrolase family 71 protein [Mycena latifolia]